MGRYHGEAIDRAQAAKAPKIPDYSDPTWDVPYELGFVTNDGEFLTRSEALERGKELGQLPPDFEPDVAEEGEVHASDFRRGLDPKFLPKPSQPLRDRAAEIAKEVGIEDYTPHQAYVPLNTGLSKQLADFYEKAKTNPQSPEVKKSYDAFIDETLAQYRALIAAGYKIEPWKGEGEPYKNSADAIADVRDNKHLFVMPTSKSFSGDKDNLLLRPSGVEGLDTVNDVFRGVHDVLGHAVEGYEFGPRGEFNAWAAHSAMYTPEAQSALAAETLLQNSWVNFGPHLRDKEGKIPAKGDKDFVPLTERPFAEQKNVVVPQNLISEAQAVGAPKGPQDVKFLPKKKGDEKKSAFPDYVVDAPHNRGLETTVDKDGVTSEFWIHSKTGKVILAPDGHEEAAYATILKNEPAIRESDNLAKVYDAMHARGWVRGVMEPPDSSQPGILLSGPKDLALGASARRTLEDIAFKTDRPVLLNDRQIDIGPVQPNDAPDSLFLPKKQKRDDEGRPLTKDGLIDYERLYKEKSAAEKKKQNEEPSAAAIEKYNIPNNQQELTASGLTGWILPNKKFVPLDAAYHQDFLAENADKLNKQFGTKFSNESNVEARLDAINAGFTRVRYEPNKGALHIETAAKNWSAVRKQILNKILDSEGSIDNLYVTLLDPKGNTVDSISEKLFNADGTEKLNKIEAALDSLRPRGSQYLPKEQALPGFKIEKVSEDEGTKLAQKNIAKARNEFPEARLPVYARDDNGNVRKNWEGAPLTVPVDYDLSNTPLAKEAAKGLKGPEREKAIATALGDKLVREYKSAVKNPAIEAGSKWYSTARTRLRKLLGDDSKFFAELLGATSPQTGVETNFKYAVEAYNQFKSGAYDDILAKYREGKKAWSDAQIDDFLRDTKIEEPTRGQFLDWWTKKYNLIPEQSSGKRFGLHSRAVLRVLDRSWLSEVKGPKTPNFTGNLTGETFEATIDVWAARALHRLANEGNPKRWRILPGNETGVADPDFYLGQAAFRHAAEKLNIKPDALQAVLWFARRTIGKNVTGPRRWAAPNLILTRF